MGDPELPGNHAGPDPVVSHLHDLVADVVGQRAPVDENPSELIHPALAQRGGHWERGKKMVKKGKKKSVEIPRIPPRASSLHPRDLHLSTVS